MIHSYSTDVAIAVGGVPEAVVLKEVAYWCRMNEEKGVNKHDGRCWTFSSGREWQERFPELNVRGILSKLRKDGWLLAGNFNDNPWDHTLWYALSDKSVALFGGFDLQDSDNRMYESGKSNKSTNTSGKIEEIQKKYAAEIDRIYAMYPGRTETKEGVRSTGKCRKDKARIASLLKDHTPEQIEHSIGKYLEETGGRYLKNFSTLLNNLPEYDDGDGIQAVRHGTGQDW